MKKISLKELADATGGEIISGNEKAIFSNIVIDSRQVDKNSLFVPIVGEKNDAHKFLDSVYEMGCRVAISSKRDIFLREDFNIVLVDDTTKALQSLGKYIRNKLTLPLVGVTGSVGKTTTREMVALALSDLKVFKTPNNFNSQVGVPITLSRINDEEIGVIELGMSQFGEMEKIAEIVKSDCALVTNIGTAHIENLHTRENIRSEKFHIMDGMKEGSVVFLNADNDLLENPPKREGIIYKYFSAKGNTDCDFYATDIVFENAIPKFTAHIGENTVRVNLHVFGEHQISNALVALAVADHYKLSIESAAKHLEEFRGFAHRQELIKLKGLTIIDDTYNASPDSMKASISILEGFKANRKIAILADMKELGADERKLHREIGDFINENVKPDAVFTVGELAKEILLNIDPYVFTKSFDDNDSLEKFISEYFKDGDVCLLKGSNSMKLFDVVEKIKKYEKFIC
ncbi:UDP-N-acetylmuramoyl-tripeptide--D-alanyl-D-alanine ligase [Lachnoanaerobaculum umeaense]|jgi:UDP-N-acetylmuramoyl-tripeptide--D-alanyl-D-alanine ligase|uniref:UDP-N-acetylmuramoyl-tripeptide--D-alanyl-D-alanine ligase n=1 Tax=Lachnoanaerobaculum umeaense TaxID=617123 RepID=A0A385PYF4_9FIRM|nr:UDP-N-acetylmuramoyl-tripeptide--D-alanyl-D-alanine ligase [Lachnoanaerobaculum umeaense]AYA99130.1 UDP-N-acetylmuramoyl-tripeptide--D-alanyl-D-alanine ligase [Lachnoanaerobaculum umeaense]PZW93324.1 UDP-N-acetylmuramoyl-tripeptide--D-alanyl-D-alanine ligase [Lachnoanaerobaculum umeaense]